MSKFSKFAKNLTSYKVPSFPDKIYSIEGVGGGTFAIASNQGELKQLKKSDADLVFWRMKRRGKLYLNQNGSKGGWGKNKDGGGLLANFENTELSADHFEGFSTHKSDLITGNGIDIRDLLNKSNEMEKTVRRLQDSNKNLRKSNKNLQESFDALKTSGGSTKNNSTNKDDITGLDARVSSLEDHVKIDRDKLPSSNPNAGIGYFILRNQEDIKSNTSQFDSVYKRFAALESNIAGNHISDYTNFDVIAKINDLISRLSAVEDALG